jgi:Amt family ammonium transporter
MTLNGVLGGLVGITAGCANLVPGFAILTGLIAGVIVVYASLALDKFVDDPVGAIAVHGVCGAWGTLAAGLFNTGDLFNMGVVGVQLIGIAAAFLWTFPMSYIVFKIADAVVGLRLNGQIEKKGLDIHEHDVEAYPEFVTNGEEAQHSPVATG